MGLLPAGLWPAIRLSGGPDNVCEYTRGRHFGAGAGSFYHQGLFSIPIRVEEDYVVLSVQMIQVLLRVDVLKSDRCLALLIAGYEFQLFTGFCGGIVKCLKMFFFSRHGFV